MEIDTGSTTKISRRALVAGAGASFLFNLGTASAANPQISDYILASACKFSDGGYGAVLLDHKGAVLKRIDLPARGHDVVFNPSGDKVVVFARRPGNFATTFDVAGSRHAELFFAPQGRHFYGHGVFSTDGRLLFASENDFDNATGRIGIYDAANGFSRVGEFDSHGIGPHEIALMPGGKSIAICNGGIETHPNSGRAKLNLDAMKPSIVFIDVRDGSLIEKQPLANGLTQLSVRHMSVALDSTIVFGCQYQGEAADRPQLMGRVSPGVPLQFYETPKSDRKSVV